MSWSEFAVWDHRSITLRLKASRTNFISKIFPLSPGSLSSHLLIRFEGLQLAYPRIPAPFCYLCKFWLKSVPALRKLGSQQFISGKCLSTHRRTFWNIGISWTDTVASSFSTLSGFMQFWLGRICDVVSSHFMACFLPVWNIWCRSTYRQKRCCRE